MGDSKSFIGISTAAAHDNNHTESKVAHTKRKNRNALLNSTCHKGIMETLSVLEKNSAITVVKITQTVPEDQVTEELAEELTCVSITSEPTPVVACTETSTAANKIPLFKFMGQTSPSVMKFTADLNDISSPTVTRKARKIIKGKRSTTAPLASQMPEKTSASLSGKKSLPLDFQPPTSASKIPPLIFGRSTSASKIPPLVFKLSNSSSKIPPLIFGPSTSTPKIPPLVLKATRPTSTTSETPTGSSDKTSTFGTPNNMSVKTQTSITSDSPTGSSIKTSKSSTVRTPTNTAVNTSLSSTYGTPNDMSVKTQTSITSDPPTGSSIKTSKSSTVRTPTNTSTSSTYGRPTISLFTFDASTNTSDNTSKSFTFRTPNNISVNTPTSIASELPTGSSTKTSKSSSARTPTNTSVNTPTSVGTPHITSFTFETLNSSSVKTQSPKGVFSKFETVGKFKKPTTPSIGKKSSYLIKSHLNDPLAQSKSSFKDMSCNIMEAVATDDKNEKGYIFSTDELNWPTSGAELFKFVSKEKNNKEVQVEMKESSENWPNIWKLLECPVCLLIPTAHITMCTKGHHVCDNCRLKLDCCPYCQCLFTQVRNYIAEQLIDYIRLPCKYQAEGCDKSFFRQDKSQHEQECVFRLL